MISERPAEADDRAIPAMGEGDLIIGKDKKSAIGTPGRTRTRYVLLVHLPHSREHLDAVAVQLNGRPRETLGWDTPAERMAKLQS